MEIENRKSTHAIDNTTTMNEPPSSAFSLSAPPPPPRPPGHTAPSASASGSRYGPGSQPPQPQRQVQPYTSQYPSPYVAAATTDTLTARRAASGSSAVDPGGYLLNGTGAPARPSADAIAGSRRVPAAVASSGGGGGDRHDPAVALLLVPPLAFLFGCEMSSSLPLLALLCCGLAVYACDLANVGAPHRGDGPPHPAGGGGGRGYYTLCAVWTSWLLLSCVVFHDCVFLREEATDGILWPAASDVSFEGRDEGEDAAAATAPLPTSSFDHVFGLALLLARPAVYILLLFLAATWTTLQFRWLPLQMPLVARFLEQILCATAPPVSAAVVAYGVWAVATEGTSFWSYAGAAGTDAMALLVPHAFALHLALGIRLVGAAPSSFAATDETDGRAGASKESKGGRAADARAIHPRDGRRLSYLLVLLPPLLHLLAFRRRLASAYASWDDAFDAALAAAAPYALHYLLASSRVLGEPWRRSLPWPLRSGTAPAEERTLRGAALPVAASLVACLAFQARYLLPLCARASYIAHGHDGVVSPIVATAFLTGGTVLALVTAWFFGRQNEAGEYLAGEYHEDVFQLLLAASASCLGLSFGPSWTFLPMPVLFAESLALWAITKQLRYAIVLLEFEG